MRSNAFLIIGLCLLLVIGFTHKLTAQGKTLGWVQQMGGTGSQNAGHTGALHEFTTFHDVS